MIAGGGFGNNSRRLAQTFLVLIVDPIQPGSRMAERGHGKCRHELLLGREGGKKTQGGSKVVRWIWLERDEVEHKKIAPSPRG